MPQTGSWVSGPCGMDIAEETEVFREIGAVHLFHPEAEFDTVIGSIMDAKLEVLQKNFMDKDYQEFEDTEENKLTYMPIDNDYLSLEEKYIEEQLLERIPGFSMAAFTTILSTVKLKCLMTYLTYINGLSGI